MHEHLSPLKRSRVLFRAVVPMVAAGLPLLLAGCSHFHSKPADKYVYVISKQSFLRDRVAAVSNRTGQSTLR